MVCNANDTLEYNFIVHLALWEIFPMMGDSVGIEILQVAYESITIKAAYHKQIDTSEKHTTRHMGHGKEKLALFIYIQKCIRILFLLLLLLLLLQ